MRCKQFIRRRRLSKFHRSMRTQHEFRIGCKILEQFYQLSVSERHFAAYKQGNGEFEEPLETEENTVSTVCPINFDVEQLKSEVRAIYSQVADDPNGDFHFHRGMDYATNMLGYDRAALEGLPPRATARLCGTGNPHKMGR